MLFLCGPASAADDRMGLMQAYEAALANDPKFQWARAARQEGLEYQALGRARVLPTVSAVASSNRNRAEVTDSNGRVDNRGGYASSTSSLQLRQPLYDPGAWAARDQGIARTAASEALFASREQELMVRVFDAYSRALLAAEEVRLVQAQLRALDEQLRSNEQRLAGGEGTRTDVLETASKRSLMQAHLVVAQDHAQSELNALQAMIGVPVGTLERLKADGAGVPPLADSLDEWRARVLTFNSEVESLKQAIAAARQEVVRVESGHLPRLELLMSVGDSQSDTTSTYQQSSRTGTVGLQLNVPLYAGGAVSAAVRQALAQLSKAEADLASRVAELQVDLQRQYRVQRSSVQRIEALVAAVVTSHTLVDATRRSFVGGERTNVDVLDSQERLAQSIRDLIEARYQQLFAGLRVRQLAGVLQEPDLRAVAAQFGDRP
ncbi:TolC family outer membrane protein [Variovorax saccharolyticus]|uniref:TolC family outer membrane protein n=1 Tax=Variovorax saccharolyticus TaxID=3053516 RepID=UPI0025784EEC|nr:MULTISPECIES: TolC family outer membrane protein [unclassified Variovorax]MDM0021046.1 TolC family outer membrane protein [Variovorax sp. J22R187]